MNELILLNQIGEMAGVDRWTALLAQAPADKGFNLWATFSQAEMFGKIIVLLLICFSFIAWTVMIGKYLDLKRVRLLNLEFQAKLKQTGLLLGMNIGAGLRQNRPYARLFHDAVEAGRQHRGDGNDSVRMGLIENALQRGVAEECVGYESKMVVLGSLVSGAPFIGLLGTVWGVMVAFSGMGQEGTTLQNLAPGVASALLATVAGLLVAIPSVFGYNFLLTQVKMMITELENYASMLADRIELELEGLRAAQAPVVPSAPEANIGQSPAPVVIKPVPSVQTSTAPATAPAKSAPPAAPAETPPTGDAGAAAAERYLRLDVSEEDGR